MSQKLPIRIRKATEADVNFIFSSWLKSYRNSHFAKMIANAVYFDQHHKLIEGLLKKNEVYVACAEADTTQLYGYACGGYEQGFLILHYIYVKHDFRNLGVGKELLNSFDHDPAKAGLYTHHTRIADRLAPKYNFVFHPYLVFDIPEGEE